MHEERAAAAAAAVAVMSSGEYKSIPIRDSNRFESIRFVKNRPFDSLVVLQFFLLTAYLLYSLSQKNTPQCTQLKAIGLLYTTSTKNSYAMHYAHTHTHTRLTALFRDYPGGPVPER